MIVASYGGHISKPSDMFRARFAVNGEAHVDGSEDWGSFFLQEEDFFSSGSGHFISFRPFCFAQMFRISSKTEAKVDLLTKHSKVKIRDGGAMVAAFPPPASLSTIKVSFSQEDPLLIKDLGPPHCINAMTKALLIMTFNGKVSNLDQESGGSISFELDDTSPTAHRDDDNNVHKFGFYLNDRIDMASEFVSLTQLAVVENGPHTVQLVGEGPLFAVNEATSQVMIIPANSVQIHTKRTDQWEMTTEVDVTTSLITVELETKQDNSILVIAASFNARAECDALSNSVSFYEVNVDGKHLYPSIHNGRSQFGTWYKDRTGDPTHGTHGSMLAFAKLAKGQHSVELSHCNKGMCKYITKGAILQVGVVPGDFTVDAIVPGPVPVVDKAALDAQRVSIFDEAP